MNKTAASAAQSAKCVLLHACSSQLRKHKQKLHIVYLTSWHIIVFLVINYEQLRTIEAKNP